MQRMGMVIGLNAEKLEEYKRLHADVWPGVLSMITACNIRNYSIFLREPENLLFGYWEYHGIDFEADAAKMAADPETQKWWDVCMPCQVPLESRREGEWWAMMDEVFHLE
ncbi:L-rhamnose mutarotase [uncultured Roseobacter sp.]|uniref:L-rhamnose mutarotase n=1 Tax=uncultured Roseobacter sp. TaxID=114847 RepID=UPI00262721F0|nr:L-rhamnose mutarotase [uncultured Roseobacter sp.]